MAFRKFLLEIGTEEMPYWAVEHGIEALREKLSQTFEEAALEFGNLQVFGGPRRFAVIADVAARQKDRKVEVKGPAFKAAFDENGNPTKAAIGFARSQGIDLSELVVKEVEGGKYVFAVYEVKGSDAKEFLKSALPLIISQLEFKKSMRWGSHDFRFVRPIRWIVALIDDDLIEFEIAGVKSGRFSRGHRVLGEKEIEITDASVFLKVLENQGKVLVDHGKRSAMILAKAKEAAERIQGEVIINDETFKEVLHIVEWPNVVVGEFDEKFLSLPEGVLVTVMQHHQRYFPVKSKKGGLMNKFVVVHNGDPAFEELIKEGNERVVKARLEDARFFFEEDLKTRLEDLVPKLKGVVFQKKLGSLFEKTERNVVLAEHLACELGLDQGTVEKVRRAAYLSKADLLTEMVNEFDELQGYMGREYALRQGEDKEVAEAIYEHYLPRFYGDELPQTDAGRVLSIADKLDTVCGYFLAGLEPTGSEDPYSLRRQAQGICLVVVKSGLNIDLKKSIEKSISLYAGMEGLLPHDEALRKLCQFFEQRFQRILSEEGFPPGVVSAVISQVLEKPAEAIAKAEVLNKNLESSTVEDAVTAYLRVRNLSRPELGTELDMRYLEEPEEIELARRLEELTGTFHELNFERQLLELAALRNQIDRFFDSVLVMHEDLNVRENRLKLLNKAFQIYSSFADFSHLR